MQNGVRMACDLVPIFLACLQCFCLDLPWIWVSYLCNQAKKDRLIRSECMWSQSQLMYTHTKMDHTWHRSAVRLGWQELAKIKLGPPKRLSWSICLIYCSHMESPIPLSLCLQSLYTCLVGIRSTVGSSICGINASSWGFLDVR